VIPPDIEAVALLGWHVFPSSQYSRAMCFEGAHDAATCDLDVIERWCWEYPGCNWRVTLGPSRLWALDVDVPGGHKHDGVGNLQSWLVPFGGLPATATTRSGGGGYALFWSHQGEPLIGKSGNPVAGVDPLRGRQTVTIPPSIHITTKRPYEWLRPPWKFSTIQAPAFLLCALRPPPEPEHKPYPHLVGSEESRNYAIKALQSAIGVVVRAPPGQANDTLNRESYSLARFVRSGVITESELQECLVAAARARNIPLREAISTIGSGLKARRA
jgi:hypothetical protein